MMLAALLLGALLPGQGPVVINEFVYDDTAQDDREFVELYNRSPADIDISGWKLAAADPLGPGTSYVVPSNTVLKKGGFWVIGTLKVPNVTQVVGSTDLWENGPESLSLLDASGKIVDTLVYESWRGVWDPTLAEGEGIWGDMTSNDGIETSWSRLRDGFDTDNNRDFRLMPQTPGTSNDRPVASYSDDFDSRKVDDELPDFGGSFAKPRVVDPAKASVHNPSALPPSPQGGHAAVFWDPAGQGNHCMLLADGAANVLVEAWVYFDARPKPAGTREVWSLGVQGTSGTTFQPPDLSGKEPGLVANGNTGVAWSYEVNDAGATLYLYDHNDGGWGSRARTPPKRLGSITIKPGVNDGWQRLRLEIRGANAEGRFGGTWGCVDGTRVAGDLSVPSPGGVWVSYRELLGLQNRALMRPFTCDRLRIGPAGDKLEYTGTAVQTTKGTPDIGASGRPLLGRKDFAIEASGLVPSGTTILFLGTGPQPAPIPLQPFGGQRGSFVYVRFDLVFVLPNDAAGKVRLPVPLPCDPGLRWTSLHWQLLDVDPALQIKLPVGNSRALVTTFD